MTHILCKCGQPKESWQDDYVLRRYNGEGNIVWAVCPHGMTVIDLQWGSDDK